MADEGLSYCHRGGAVVGADKPIPERPYDFVWPSGDAFFGCNRLVTDSGERVRSFAGYRTRGLPDNDQVAALYKRKSVSKGLKQGWIEKAAHARLYVSPDATVVASGMRFADDARWSDLGVGLPWRCGGHPRLKPPCELDGESIDVDTDWPGLLRGVIEGTRATRRPDFTTRHPLGWAQRLYHLLEHTPLAAVLARAIAHGIGDDDLTVRAACLRFMTYFPTAPGGDVLATAVLSQRDRFLNVADPNQPHSTLDTLLLHALAVRFETLGGTDEGRAVRESALWGTPSTYRLAQALGGRDRAWLVEHASAIANAAPTTLVLEPLLRAARAQFGDNLSAWLDELAASTSLERPQLIAAIKSAFTGKERQHILAAASDEPDPGD